MTRKLLVTWIAPNVGGLPQLSWLNELGRIQKIREVEVTTLTGDSVILDDVSNVLQCPADIVIWSGHGTAGGLLLSNQDVVQPQWLASQIGYSTRPHAVILAACSSQQRDEYRQ